MASKKPAKQQLEIDGRQIPVSNLDKILYPAARFTKGKVIDFYIRIAPYLLPHLKDRPVTLKRFPDGVRGDFFFEKDAPSFTPSWVETFPVPRRGGGSDIRYILINDLATLVWLGNLANLEIHPFLHRKPELERPTSIVFDLDPGEGAGMLQCGRVALMVREVLKGLRLESFVKVSGSKGLQLHVPLNTEITYGQTQPFARALAQSLETQHPDLVTSEMAKHLRAGKVFIDWSQNADFKTTVAVYSLRAKSDTPYVSLPLEWDELAAALKADDAQRLYWKPEAALARMEQRGDLFQAVLTLQQALPSKVPQNIGDERARETHRQKRKLAKTPEPEPKVPRVSRQGGRRRFVIQKHAASHLHYDFRLEMHGALKSWAVLKGPPYKLNEQCLATPAEDHPLSYVDFEGNIPKRQSGGGTVMVWDIGTYELIEGNYSKGYVRLHLSGTKLKGEWTLTKSRDRNRDTWLLVKTEKTVRAPAKNIAEISVLSGRTMEQIAERQSPKSVVNSRI